MGFCFSKNKVSDVSESIKESKREKNPDNFTRYEWPELAEHLSKKQNLMTHARAKKRQNFDNLDQVSLYLDSLPTQNDTERVWLIFTWIADNIEYNFEGYKNDQYGKCDPQSVFQSGKTVCSGYANLFCSLCDKIGIECKTIEGYAKAFDYKQGHKFDDTNHAWNAVKIDNKWNYIESTWASGVIINEKFMKLFNPYWFFTSPDAFLETHYSPDFHLGQSITLQDFEKAHQNQLEYYFHGFKKLSIPTLIESDHSPYCFELVCSKDCLLMAKLINPLTLQTFDAYVQKDFRSYPHKHCVIVDIPEKNVKYELKIFAKKVDSEKDSYPQITSYNLIRKKDEINRKIPQYSLDFGHGIRLLSHSSRYLHFDYNPFKLELSGADECMLLANLTNENDVKYKNSCLVQKSLVNKTFLIDASCPNKGKFCLNLFWKHKNSDSHIYDSLTSFVLIKEKPVQSNDIIEYTVLANAEAFVEKPIEYYLKKGNTYEFKINLDNVIKMALIDQNQDWNYFQKDSKNLYVLKWTVLEKGDVDVFAQFADGASFQSVCSYQCVS